MGRKIKNEEIEETMDSLENIEISDEAAPTIEIKPQTAQEIVHIYHTGERRNGEGLKNCLRKERVEVRLIPRKQGVYANPRHVLYGGMAEDAVKKLCVPMTESGIYVQVLTQDEEEFLEYSLGLEKGALSRYKDFWNCNNDMARVDLTKASLFLDLSNPRDYIKYKVLLANKDKVCPSQKELEEKPLPTYMFVIIGADEEIKSARRVISTIQEAYKEFGKIEDDKDTLRVIVEYLSGRPVATTTKIDVLQVKVNEYLQRDNGKAFLSLIREPHFLNRVLISKALEAGIITKRANYYYLRENSMPLCENNEEPTLEIAMRFLSAPKNQDIKFGIETKLN